MNNIYEINGHRYTTIDNALFELVRVPSDAPNAPTETDAAPVARKKYKTKAKTAKAAGTRSKYDPEQIQKIAAQVEAKEITSQQAADELGVSYANWSYLKKAYAKGTKNRTDGAEPGTTLEVQRPAEDEVVNRPILICHICDEDHLTRDCPDFSSKVAEMRDRGLDSLQIAAKLKIRMKDIPVE